MLHGDETGMRVEGILHWIHAVCSRDATLYQAHRKRGGEAIEDNGILPAFEGVLVHDCWGPYFKSGARHALCGAHLLRELQAVCENEGHRWAHEPVPAKAGNGVSAGDDCQDAGRGQRGAAFP